MPVFIEVHLIQNFAPSCLNRDDTNAPKDCEFGGHRRARISSQCIKRAIRRQFEQDLILDKANLAYRTKRLEGEVGRVLKEKKDASQAEQLAAALLTGIEIASEDKKTEYLLFLGRQEIGAIAAFVEEHWDKLAEVAAEHGRLRQENQAAKKKKSAKEMKKILREIVPADLRKNLLQSLDGGRAADLALFGRMLADMPQKNILAACQVAHALSTNRVNMETDYYTAVDDLKPEDTAGADMIGTVEFNSSCFYRYANIDFGQLVENLQGDEELARQTVKAFLQAAVEAVPTGKQNSTAAHNPPDCVFVVVRDWGLWSLANAFVQPVRASADRSLVEESIRRLDGYWGRLVSGYGDDGIRTRPVFVLGEAGTAADDRRLLTALKDGQVGRLKELVGAVMTQVGEAPTPAEVRG
jgi:CRISPR system Cascade subunit CasC